MQRMYANPKGEDLPCSLRTTISKSCFFTQISRLLIPCEFLSPLRSALCRKFFNVLAKSSSAPPRCNWFSPCLSASVVGFAFLVVALLRCVLYGCFGVGFSCG